MSAGEMYPQKPRRPGVPAFLLREALYGLSALLFGIVLVRVLNFPDATVAIGVARMEGGRGIMVDFETPTAEQMFGFQSVEEFDRWAVQQAKGFVGAVDSLRLLRVGDLASAAPDTIIIRALSWSGFARLKDNLIPPRRGNLMTTWVPLFIPYGAFWLFRLLSGLKRHLRG